MMSDHIPNFPKPPVCAAVVVLIAIIVMLGGLCAALIVGLM